MRRKTARSRHGLVIIILQGGLGNQLFQLCAGLQVSRLTGKNLVFFENFFFKKRKFALGTLVSDYERSRILTLALFPLIFMFRAIRWRFVINVNTDINELELQRNCLILNGWFQSHSLVHSVHSPLMDRLSSSELFMPLVLIQRVEAIGVHLRFGDYSNSSRTRTFHGMTALSYYDDAIKLLLGQLAKVEKIVFVTDDIDKANMALQQLEVCSTSIPIEVVSSTAIQDMAILSSCSGMVLSNSSFSWWAGYLGSELRESVVVAPKPWLANKSDFDRSLVVPNWNFIDREIQHLLEED